MKKKEKKSIFYILMLQQSLSPHEKPKKGPNDNNERVQYWTSSTKKFHANTKIKLPMMVNISL